LYTLVYPSEVLKDFPTHTLCNVNVLKMDLCWKKEVEEL
jgi:hypothetical protein